MDGDDHVPDAGTWEEWLAGVPLAVLAHRAGTDVAGLRRALRKGTPPGRGPTPLVVREDMGLWVAANGLPETMPCPCVFLRTPRAYPPHHVDRALAMMGRSLSSFLPGAALDATVVEPVDRDTCDAMQADGYLVFAMDEDGDAAPVTSPGSAAT